jgi:hypothetical protein
MLKCTGIEVIPEVKMEKQNKTCMVYESFTEKDYEIYKSLYSDDSSIHHHNRRYKPGQSAFKTILEVTGNEFLPGVAEREQINDYINKVAGNDRVFNIKNAQHIIHAFQSEDLSKEAIMLLAHSLIGE